MTTINDFGVTDDVTDNLASYHNRLLGGTVRAEFVNTETISATKELADADCQFQVLTASSTDRTVELAPEATTNHLTVIYNATPSSDNFNIVVKDDSGTATFTTLAPDKWSTFIPVSGEGWKELSPNQNNAPVQGGLVNGYISRSVASNNLTVAIKTLSGGDPSATDPVYCRVGNTVRAITAALTVTKNAGTNWCNAGGAELATKEVDYFVYLGYNATDGVVIGFSRIAHARVYSDFNTTTTDERYAAISTITTAAATDEYEVIGRFNATLSAGAGYTWSVPATSVVVSRPIYETRWMDWAPAYSASGSLTYTSVTTTSAKYKINGDRVMYYLTSTGTLGGSASNALMATVPLDSSITSTIAGNGNTANVATKGVYFSTGTPDKFAVEKYDGSNYATSGSCAVNIFGQYFV